MAKVDIEFQKLCNKIFAEGREYENKNRGVKRLQIPSYTFRHSFAEGFPALTNKELYWKGIVGELIWFLRGDNDVTFLNENKINIWNKDAYNWYVKKYSNNDPIEGQEEFYFKNEDGTYRMFTQKEFSAIGKGSVGQNYSVQWRNFNGNTDQILDLINGMKSDIMSSRLKVNAWNPSELNETALPPCHSEFQVVGVPLTFVERREFWINKHVGEMCETARNFKIDEGYLTDVGIPEFGFELHWNQRSVDTFLGLPFNIASYGLLAKVLEAMTGYPALGIEGTLKCVHFYDNQYEVAKELVSRSATKHPECELRIADKFQHSANIDEVFSNLAIQDFTLDGYSSDEPLKVEMLAPKEL